MKHCFFTLLLFAILSLLLVAPSFAGSSIRCGNYLVSVGDLKIKVLDKCGEPISKEEIGLNAYKRRQGKNVRFLEQWIYEFHHGYYDVLTFKGGKLVKIESMIPK
jgi:Protein of unknown function (DUF2845)